MHEEIKIDEVLHYLKEWRSNREIKEQFNLNQNKFYRLSRWLVKANIAERCSAIELQQGCNGRIMYYKVRK